VTGTARPGIDFATLVPPGFLAVLSEVCPLPTDDRWSVWGSDLFDCTRAWRVTANEKGFLITCSSRDVRDAVRAFVAASGLGQIPEFRLRTGRNGQAAVGPRAGAAEWRRQLARVDEELTVIPATNSRFARSGTRLAYGSGDGSTFFPIWGSAAGARSHALAVAADMEAYAAHQPCGDLLAGYARLYACVLRLNWCNDLRSVYQKCRALELDYGGTPPVGIMAAWYGATAAAACGNRAGARAAYAAMARHYRKHRWWVVAAARYAAKRDPLRWVVVARGARPRSAEPRP